MVPGLCASNPLGLLKPPLDLNQPPQYRDWARRLCLPLPHHFPLMRLPGDPCPLEALPHERVHRPQCSYPPVSPQHLRRRGHGVGDASGLQRVHVPVAQAAGSMSAAVQRPALPRRRQLVTFTVYDDRLHVAGRGSRRPGAKRVTHSYKVDGARSLWALWPHRRSWADVPGRGCVDGSSRRGWRWCQSASTRPCQEKLRLARGVVIIVRGLAVAIFPLNGPVARLNGPPCVFRSTFC